MRLGEITIKNQPPITHFEVSGLSDVVVLAGRNGIGKTRILDALVACFRSPAGSKDTRLILEATDTSESKAWDQARLDTSVAADAQKLLAMLRQPRRRSRWRSSVLRFESNRSVAKIEPYQFTWDASDPWDEEYGWNATFGGLQSRLQDTLHSILRKVRSHHDTIARRYEELRRTGEKSMSIDVPDVLAPFKTSFAELLAPKELEDADLRNQTLRYRDGDQVLTIDKLSSGEREVLNIAFDLILRTPRDCIILFDEPELHLHPELSYKLLQALRNIGERNQFVYCTHSPDIITASLDQSVIFVGPPSTPPNNQAIPVKEQDDTNQALRLLGQSVGVIALGKRLVLIEGTRASLDKQVYGSILRSRCPGLVLVPSGGKGLIQSFSTIVTELLDKAIWGVEFFMLCDRDALPIGAAAIDITSRTNGRLRVLPRYHLENYFLDAGVLAKAFGEMEPEESWLRDPGRIDAALFEIAQKQASYAAALIVSARLRLAVGNVDLMPKDCHDRTPAELNGLVQSRAGEELTRVRSELDPARVAATTSEVMSEVAAALESKEQRWKTVIPGRPILNMFAAKAGLEVGRLKHLYLNAARAEGDSPFSDVVEIFDAFARRAVI